MLECMYMEWIRSIELLKECLGKANFSVGCHSY